MASLEVMIWSYGGIPEPLVFVSKEEMLKEWREAHDDIYSTPKERGENYPLVNETIKDGYMDGHKSEAWMRDAVIPGIVLSPNDILQLMDEWIAGNISDSPVMVKIIVNGYMTIVKEQIVNENRVKFSHLFPAICDKCKKGMYSGYTDGQGFLACNNRCLFTDGYTKEQFDIDYKNGHCWWTEWEDWIDAETPVIEILDRLPEAKSIVDSLTKIVHGVDEE